MTVLTQARLKHFLHYEPSTGVFTRLIASGTAKAGDHAENIIPSGYVQISVDGRSYLGHRLAWLYVFGRFPENHTDHINGCKSDNRIANLREATAAQNAVNFAMQTNNTSGVKGVYWSTRRRKWIAQIGIGGAVRNLGGFATLEEAKAVRAAAEIKHQGEFRCQHL